MKEVKFVPTMCLEGGDFSGHIMLKVPGFDERYEMLDQIGLKIDADGSMSAADMNGIGAIRKLVQFSQKFYKEISIEHKDGRKFESFDDLSLDPECDAILIEVAGKLRNGFRVGKN